MHLPSSNGCNSATRAQHQFRNGEDGRAPRRLNSSTKRLVALHRRRGGSQFDMDWRWAASCGRQLLETALTDRLNHLTPHYAIAERRSAAPDLHQDKVVMHNLLLIHEQQTDLTWALGSHQIFGGSQTARRNSSAPPDAKTRRALWGRAACSRAQHIMSSAQGSSQTATMP